MMSDSFLYQPTDASQWNELFLLRPDVTFLNFGSFGATPKPIFEAYQLFQCELEYEPVQFILNQGPKYLQESREALGKYLACAADDLVFVPNPTHAVNLVVKSLQLQPGDEVLTTNLEYGACDRTWEYYCGKRGARYVKQMITLPIQSKEAFLADFRKGFSDKTRMVFISQITSATGLILPIEELCQEAKQRGIPVFIDGAHVPGHIPLSLTSLDVDYYTGACHKWMMTPKGSSFLYVRKELQATLDPLIISWGYQADFPSHSQFLDYHQFNGTRDYSAYLTIPKAIAFMKEYQWEKQADACRKRTQYWLKRLCDVLESTPISPITDEFIGQLGSIPIQTEDPIVLKQLLYDKYRIEIPVPIQGTWTFIRFSIQVFNGDADLQRLEEVLLELKQMGILRGRK